MLQSGDVGTLPAAVEPNLPLPVLHLSVCPRHPPQSAINKSANELALVTAHVARAAAAFNPDTAVCTTLALAP